MGGSEARQFAQHSLLLFFLVYKGLERLFFTLFFHEQGTLLNVTFGKHLKL